MRLTADGLIVRERNIKDDQRLVVVLTAERGLITAFVSGVRKMRSRTSAPTQLLCYSSLTFFRGRNTYKIDEASLLESFFKLRQDIEKLSLAQYLCELSLCLAPEEEEAGDFLRLMLYALHYLAEEKRPGILIKAVAELRMLSLSGYMPDLSGCAVCGGDKESMRFDAAGGRLICADCGTDMWGEPLPRGVLTAMRHILSAQEKKLFSFTLPEAALERLGRECEGYIAAQTDRSFKSLDFYREIRRNI